MFSIFRHFGVMTNRVGVGGVIRRTELGLSRQWRQLEERKRDNKNNLCERQPSGGHGSAQTLALEESQYLYPRSVLLWLAVSKCGCMHDIENHKRCHRGFRFPVVTRGWFLQIKAQYHPTFWQQWWRNFKKWLHVIYLLLVEHMIFSHGYVTTSLTLV